MDVPAFADARDLLTPTIQNRPVTEAMALEGRDSADYETQDDWKPLGAHHAIHVSIDRPHSFLGVTAKTLDDWGCSFDDVLAIAVENLRQRAVPDFEVQEGGWRLSRSDDGNDAARLLTPEAFAHLSLKGSPVVIAAARRWVGVAGADDPVALDAMARALASVAEMEPRPISLAPLVLRAGEWRELPKELGDHWLADLLRLQAQRDYDGQADLIHDRLRRQGRPHGLAPVSLVSENGRLFSVSLWREPASLVPVCDFVVIRSGAGRTVARRWEDFSRALGGLRIEPDVLPSYAVMDGWPDAAAFAALIRAPEPAWAAGRGLGVANGRLTIFG